MLIRSFISVRAEVVEKTAAILFFGELPCTHCWRNQYLKILVGTPHRATSALNALNSRLYSILGGKPQLLDSSMLQETNEQFLHLAQRFEIVDFYETQFTNMGITKFVT